MMNTKIAVRTVSSRDGQTTLLISERTWRTNSPGLVFFFGVGSAMMGPSRLSRTCLVPSG